MPTVDQAATGSSPTHGSIPMIAGDARKAIGFNPIHCDFSSQVFLKLAAAGPLAT